MTDALRTAWQALETARKRLTMTGKGASGNAVGESAYAEAYAAICKLDPTVRPVKRKYR